MKQLIPRYTIRFVLVTVAILYVGIALYILLFSVGYLSQILLYPVDINLTRTPNESNRMYLPNGASMVCPTGWKVGCIKTKNDDSFAILEFQGGDNRFPCLIAIDSAKCIEECQIPPSMKKSIASDTYSMVTFQKEYAFEFVNRVPKKPRIPDPAYISGRLYFFRYGWCYMVRYRFVNREMCVPPNLNIYLDSFRPGVQEF